MKVPSVPNRRAFTLIELLVVISIIAILMTLLFPAVSSAIYAARKTQAKNDATQIATAINAYMSEYGKMPTDGTSDVDGTANTNELMNALNPDPGSTNTLNPRGMVFLEIPNAKSGKNGRVDNNGAYKDPWTNDYFISLDGNYDQRLKDPSGGSDITKTVLVWSKGDKNRTNEYSDPKKWIKSWE